MTQVHEKAPLEKRSLGLIMLSGLVLSVLIAFGCLLLIPLGGLFVTAGMIGFSINLLEAVFEMLPIKPCDGRDVYFWNTAVWAVVFTPLILIYFIANLCSPILSPGFRTWIWLWIGPPCKKRVYFN